MYPKKLDVFYHYVLMILSNVNGKLLLTTKLFPPPPPPCTPECDGNADRGANVYICQNSLHYVLKVEVFYSM